MVKQLQRQLLMESRNHSSISADEVQDCGNKEQMPMVIRHINNERMIQEKFIKFILCDTGLTKCTVSKDKGKSQMYGTLPTEL